MSPFLAARLPAEDELARDMGALAKVLFADEIRILGGEPLLNPRIVPILRAARASEVAARVVVPTNGVLLHTMPDDFWENVDEVRLNLYPGARPNERRIEQARQRAQESGTQLEISGYSSFRVTMVTEPHPPGPITNLIFRTCKNAHMYHCHMVHAGWFYKCSCPAYFTEYLARLGQPGYQPENDGFDIHRAADLRTELWRFLTESRALDACRHCLGYVGKQQTHEQLTTEETRDARCRPITRRTHLSRSALIAETCGYFGRRLSEPFVRKPQW
ncbi:MAG: radical SAM protein [Acidobacteriia bacterium]|nr:radical SAM protein [Terriglobia bacterium]